MDPDTAFSDFTDTEYLLCNNGIIKDIGYAFIELTGYSKADIYQKDISEIIKLLKINCTVCDLKNNNINTDLFLFTKSLEPIEIFISIHQLEDTSQTLYILTEKPNSRLDDKLIFVKKTISDNIIGAAVYSVPDLILLKANQKYLDFMDVPYNTMECSIGRPIREIVTGFVGSQSEVIWNNVIETEDTSYIKEFEFDKFSRGITYWDSTQTPIFEHGKKKYIYENAIEVSKKVLERKKREALAGQVEYQNVKLEAIIEHMSDAICVFDKNGQFIHMNEEGRRIYQQEFLEVQDENNEVTRLFDSNGKQTTLAEMSVARLDNGKEMIAQERIVAVRSDMYKIFDVNTTRIYDEDGMIDMVIVSSKDITKMMRKKEKLSYQKILLEAVIENIPDPFAIYDNKGNLITMNAAGRKLYPQQDTVKTSDAAHKSFEHFDLAGNVILPENLPTRRALKGEQIRNEVIVIKRGGKDQITEVNVTPIFDRDNNLISYASFHRDITETVQNQRIIEKQQLQNIQTEKNKVDALKMAIETKDEFLSIMSHEFKTPINVINSAIQAIELICKDELSGKAKRYLNMIRQNVFRQLRLVNNLLDITRINAGNIKLNVKNYDIVFLTQTIVESVSSFSGQKGITLSVTSTSKKKAIGLDEEKYERILLNLLSNAIKFTPAGKHVSVMITSMKELVKIEVKDEGMGIPEDKQELIFERFGQVDSSLSRQAEGSGIGLSLVRIFVEALGGSISVESKVGNGSTFAILLPAYKVKVSKIDKDIQQLSDNRLIQSTAIEFSDIYLT